VWVAGAALAIRFGSLISQLSGIALILFGLWMAIASIRELHDDRKQHRPGNTALLLILGSSPMVEGIPTFFAAGRFGAGLLAVMAGCFALSTIATYVVLCVYSHGALEAVSLGPLERYGEVLSGASIAVVGAVFLLWSAA
jgi:hypothetical protein